MAVMCIAHLQAQMLCEVAELISWTKSGELAVDIVDSMVDGSQQVACHNQL